MRVGFFTYGMRDKLTGIGRYAVELTRALQALDQGVEITLLNPYPESPLTWYREFDSYALPSLKRLPMAASWGNVALAVAARRLKLDILHDPCGVAPFLLPGGRYAKVVTIHDAVPLVMPNVQPFLTRAVFRTLIPASRYAADAIMTISQASADDLERYAGIPRHKLYPVHYGVTLPPPMSEREVHSVLSRLEISRPYFLFVGAINPRKNLARIVHALAEVRRDAEVSLVVAGPKFWGADQTYHQVQASAGVTLTGYLPEHELHALFYGAAGLVWPSLYEGFGLPPLEAMAHGTPVITSTVSSLPEVVGDAAILVDPGDTQAIAGAMKRLLADRALARTLAQRGLARARTFSWKTNAEKTLALYLTLLGASRRVLSSSTGVGL